MLSASVGISIDDGSECMLSMQVFVLRFPLTNKDSHYCFWNNFLFLLTNSVLLFMATGYDMIN